MLRTLLRTAVAGFAVGVVSCSASSPTDVPDDTKPIPVRPDSELPYSVNQFLYTTDQMITVYLARVDRDKGDYMSRTTLGGFYLKRAKESGDHSAYDRADEMFVAALKIIPMHEQARIGRAAVAGSKHKFADMLRLAEEVYKGGGPDGPFAAEAQVAMADAQVELGRYDAADASLKDVAKKAGEPVPAILARQSRLAELRGDIPRAVALLKQATEIEKKDEATTITLAWYAARLGEMLLTQGKTDEAAAMIESAVKDNPVMPDLKVMLAKARIAQGRPADAVAIMTEVLKVDKDLDTWIPFGDALTMVGDTKRAEEQYAAAHQKATKEEPVAVRELILHYCDTNRHLPRALQLAKREMAAGRNDVFSCDSLAWASYMAGDLAAAEKASADALRIGTRDATLYYHAGMIAQKAGKPEKAKEYLAKALEINPRFSVAHAAEAKKVLGK